MFFPVLLCGSMVRSRLAVCLWRRLHQWRAWLDWVRAAVYDCARFAGVAQLVEQRIRNAQVMGSSPFTGSRHFSFFISPRLLAGFFVLAGCGLSAVMSGAHSVSAIFFVVFCGKTRKYCIYPRQIHVRCYDCRRNFSS